MKQYLDALRDIHTNGIDYMSRTGEVRRRIFGVLMRMKMADGFPLLTTKKVFFRGLIEETIWFVQGLTNVDHLIQKNVHIWDDWRAQREHLTNPSEHLMRVLGPDDDFSMDRKIAIDEMNTKVGTVGPMYGAAWRNAPGGGDMRTMVALFGDKYIEELRAELASDKWDKIQAAFPNDEEMQKRAVVDAYNTIDQLQQLIVNLKRNPYSSRHVITAWFPESLPDERIKPWDNVLLGRQALAACHCMFQFNVMPAAEEGGPLRLSCLLFQR